MIEGYKKVTTWPSAILKSKIITYKKADNTVWVDTDSINNIKTITNNKYNPAGIQFAFTTEFKV